MGSMHMHDHDDHDHEDEGPIPMDALLEEGAEVRDGPSKTTSIIRSTLAIVSLIASSTLIWTILRSRIRLSTTYHRLILGMCISDILYSLALTTFNFMSPRDVDYYVWNAKGNVATCSAQGFFVVLGAVSGLVYSCCLNFYSIAVVKFRKPDIYIRKKIEPFLHGVPIAFGLATGIAVMLKKGLNSDEGGICFNSEYRPPHCIGVEDGEVREGFTIPCGRGDDGRGQAVFAMFLFTLFVAPVVNCICLGILYRSVWQQEKLLARYGANAYTTRAEQNTSGGEDEDGYNNFLAGVQRRFGNMCRRSGQNSSSPGSNQDRNRSRSVLNRALAYSVAYFLTWSFVIAHNILHYMGLEVPTAIWYLISIFNPLQGLYNLLIYLQPKVLSAKRSRKDITWCEAVSKAFGYEKTASTFQSNSNDIQSERKKQKMPEKELEEGVSEAKSDEGGACDVSEAKNEKALFRRRSSEIV